MPWAIITGAGSALGRSTPALAGALAASRDIDPAAVAPVLTGEPFRLNIEAQHLLGHFGLNFCQSI